MFVYQNTLSVGLECARNNLKTIEGRLLTLPRGEAWERDMSFYQKVMNTGLVLTLRKSVYKGIPWDLLFLPI